jgi:hypothetical protein
MHECKEDALGYLDKMKGGVQIRVNGGGVVKSDKYVKGLRKEE